MINKKPYGDWRTKASSNSYPEAPESVDITLDTPYTLLIGNGGAIAIDKTSEQWKEADKIKKLIGYFERFVYDPNSFIIKAESIEIQTDYQQTPEMGGGPVH